MTHILVTNDDGVTAPGLFALADALRALGDVSVLAPDRNWSASGHVKTMHKPLRVREIQLQDGSTAHTSDGAPSDCVALAVMGILPDIDLVVSGINPHANIGHDVTYSGTVTAAMEAVIWGLPGLAVSLDSPDNHLGVLDYGPAAEYARRVAEMVIQKKLPTEVVLNLNVPYLQLEEIKGIQVTRQGHRIYNDALLKRIDPRGVPYYWMGGEPPTGVPDEGTDYGAIKTGFASLTPLNLDLTAEDSMDQITKILAE